MSEDKWSRTRSPRTIGSVAAALIVTIALASGARTAAAAENESGKKLLAELVQKANQEGKLVATVQSSWGHAILPQLIDAFKKRFGLTIDVSLTPVASARQF